MSVLNFNLYVLNAHIYYMNFILTIISMLAGKFGKSSLIGPDQSTS